MRHVPEFKILCKIHFENCIMNGNLVRFYKVGLLQRAPVWQSFPREPPARRTTTHTQRNKKNKDDNESDNLRFFCCKFGRAQKKGQTAHCFTKFCASERARKDRDTTQKNNSRRPSKQRETSRNVASRNFYLRFLK